jgi:hypothetical protein
MKNLTKITVILFVVTFIASSCGSPYKKRKGCRGNGSWYGNRNLGAVDQKAVSPETYRLGDLTASID